MLLWLTLLELLAWLTKHWLRLRFDLRNVMNDGWMHASDARLLCSEFVTVKFTRVFCFSSIATNSVFAWGVQPICETRMVAELVEDAAPHYCRHHPSASAPLCCLLPVSLTAVSRAPANGRTPINCVHVTATANVYIAKLLIQLRHWGFNLIGRPRSGLVFKDSCAKEVEYLWSKCCISSDSY